MSEKKAKKPKSKARVIVEWTLTIVFGLAFLFAGVAQIDGMIHRDEHFGQTLRFGWGSFVVLTDSMADYYPVDTAIITHLDDPEDMWKAYNQGQTIDITFQNGYESYELARFRPSDPQYTENVTTQSVFTHRIFEMREDTSVEKGQGRYLIFVAGTNTGGSAWKKSQYQVLTERSLLGVVKGNSNVLGWFFRVVSSPWGLLIFLLVPAGYLVVVSVLDIFKGMKEVEEGPKVPPGGEGGGGSLEGLSEEDKKRLKEEMLQQMMEERMKGGDKK